MYYLRSRPARDPVKFAVDKTKMEKNDEKEKQLVKVS